jgi:hypothetical protein
MLGIRYPISPYSINTFADSHKRLSFAFYSRSTSGRGPESRSRRGASRDQEALSAPQAASWGLAHLQFLERVSHMNAGFHQTQHEKSVATQQTCSVRKTPVCRRGRL